MEKTCERAVEMGMPAITFTEHADFVEVHKGQRELDVEGYMACLEECRRRFPALRIIAGIELGEPHRYIEKTRASLARGTFGRVLGSVHCADFRGELKDASQVKGEGGDTFARAYLDEVIALVRSNAPFDVLAHLDYPKRYWKGAWNNRVHEERIRMILRELADRGGALEVNTTRGIDPAQGLCPDAEVLRWWVESGGRAVSLGSDAHSADKIAEGFAHASEVIEACGFRPNDDPTGFWLR